MFVLVKWEFKVDLNLNLGKNTKKIRMGRDKKNKKKGGKDGYKNKGNMVRLNTPKHFETYYIIYTKIKNKNDIN